MKIPKKTKRYCPFCKKVTEQKVKQVSSGTKPGAMKRGSLKRAKLRGLNRGFGNQGRRSRPAVSKYKRKTKTTKKPQILYTCTVCNKSKNQKKGKRTSKLQIE
jgi:large subunit ribosomal protein L44e